MTEGVDYSWGRPSPTALKAAGKEFVVRYVNYPGAGGKGLTRAEMREILSAGLNLVLVWESTASRPLEGWAAGNEDASRVKLEMANLGLPADMPCYFAVDFDAVYAQLPAIRQYLEGASYVLSQDRVGVYGSHYVIEAFAGDYKYLWQTYAWSGGKISDAAALYQYQNDTPMDGAAVDLNRAFKEDYGQFPRPRAVVPPPPQNEDTEALVRRIFDEEFPRYFRDLMVKYWVDNIGKDYADENGVPVPPDSDVVKAISEEVLGYWWGTVGNKP